MKVTLLNFTQNPLETFWIARKSQQLVTPSSIKEVTKTVSIEDLETNYIELAKEGLTSPMEFVSTQWKLEGVSRELQQQITRHRIGISFSIESMRVMPKDKFATNGEYRSFDHLPEKQSEFMNNWMKQIEDLYQKGQELGIPTQDLRAGLPLGINSTITMSAAWNSLIGLIEKRLCLKAQEEIQELGRQMVLEIANKMPRIMAKDLLPPCAKGWCVINPENERQYSEGKTKGVQNTDQVCPLWINLKKGKSNNFDQFNPIYKEYRLKKTEGIND